MSAVPSQNLRLFLGLWPAPEVRDAIAAHADRWDWPAAARRTRPERLHATLHFLGPVSASRLPQLQRALDLPWPGCELQLDQAQVWPGGIAVLEATDVPPPLARLHSQLAQRLELLEIVVDARPYRPHVTLARKALGAQPPAAFDGLRWQAGSRYVLVQSLPGGRGYEPLHAFG